LLLALASLHGLFGLSKEEAYHSLWFVALETFLLIVVFMVIVELAGRKTVAQMTMLQMIVTIGIGEALLMPVMDENFSFLKTVVIVGVLILFVIVTEWLEIKFNWFERLITNRALLVVEDGEINVKNLRKLRMSVDQLEMQIRTLGINSIHQLKVATVEANGQLGWQLKDEEQHLRIRDLEDFINNNFPQTKIQKDMYKEITDYEHSIKNKNNQSENLK
jgi:uncharacterized membrane protein YcaP (DUF421 family)